MFYNIELSVHCDEYHGNLGLEFKNGRIRLPIL